MLGGISASRVPPLAQTPVASPLSYFCLSISGTARRAITAAAATLEPEAAPKPAQAQLVATASPPGSAPNPACAARNSAVPIPELPAMAPISRNIGIADRSQLAANTNGVSLSALSATLKLRKYQKPRNATAPIAIPIGTRSAISTSMPPRLTSDSVSASIAPPPSPDRHCGRSAPRRGSHLRDHAQNEIDNHEEAGHRQDPSAGPNRQVHGAGEPHLACPRLPQRGQEGLIGEHRHEHCGEKLDRDVEPEIEARRADVLEHAGDDVTVAAGEEGPGAIGYGHHIVGGDDLGGALQGAVEQVAAGHVDGDVRHHQEARDEAKPEQKMDRPLQPCEQAVHGGRSQRLRIDMGKHLARQRVRELVDVAPDSLRHRSPALDRLLVVVDDDDRILHAEAFCSGDIGLALDLLVVLGDRGELVADLDQLHTLVAHDGVERFLVRNDEVADRHLGAQPGAVFEMDLLLLGREALPGIAVHQDAEGGAGKPERIVHDIFRDVAVTEGAYPIDDAVLAIQPPALQQAHGLDQGGTDRHHAGDLEHVGIAAGGAHALALEVGHGP